MLAEELLKKYQIASAGRPFGEYVRVKCIYSSRSTAETPHGLPLEKQLVTLDAGYGIEIAGGLYDSNPGTLLPKVEIPALYALAGAEQLVEELQQALRFCSEILEQHKAQRGA